MCLCTGMLYDPQKVKEPSKKTSIKVFKRLKQIKQSLFLRNSFIKLTKLKNEK